MVRPRDHRRKADVLQLQRGLDRRPRRDWALGAKTQTETSQRAGLLQAGLLQQGVLVHDALVVMVAVDQRGYAVGRARVDAAPAGDALASEPWIRVERDSP